MDGQFTKPRRRRPQGKKEVPVRSVRVTDEVWEKARRRATYEGITMSDVLATFTRGYADGLIDMPRVHLQYVPPRSPNPVQTREQEQDGAAESQVD